MIKFNYLIFAFFLSIFIHVIFVYKIQFSKKIDEVYVLDLSSYKEFKAKKIEVKQPITKELKKPKKIIKNEVVKKKLEKKIPIKQKNINKNTKQIERVKKIEEVTKNEEVKQVKKVSEKLTTDEVNQNKVIKNDTSKKLLVDQKIKSFLMKISKEINKIAVKSYPIQSIKRREQGTIVAIIVLNSSGKLVEINFESKKPRRLYEKTKQIIKNYEFPKPPSIIFEQNQTFSIKIPVNYILR